LEQKQRCVDSWSVVFSPFFLPLCFLSSPFFLPWPRVVLFSQVVVCGNFPLGMIALYQWLGNVLVAVVYQLFYLHLISGGGASFYYVLSSDHIIILCTILRSGEQIFKKTTILGAAVFAPLYFFTPLVVFLAALKPYHGVFASFLSTCWYQVFGVSEKCSID
jgi:hypothetical protein